FLSSSISTAARNISSATGRSPSLGGNFVFILFSLVLGTIDPGFYLLKFSRNRREAAPGRSQLCAGRSFVSRKAAYRSCRQWALSAYCHAYRTGSLFCART